MSLMSERISMCLQTGVTALQVATANDWDALGDELAEHMEEFPGQRRMSISVTLYLHITLFSYSSDESDMYLTNM